MTPAPPLRTVEVHLGERSYPIHLGAGTLAGAGDAIARHTKATHAAVVTVSGVGRRYAGTLLRSLRQAGLRTTRIEVPDGDAAKTLRQAARLYDRLLAGGADRGSVVVALGGGVVGDLAGFAAATYLRGVAFVQVPTTVLAMVDASIGGKVAVNLPQGKNLVGAFHQPRLVWIDVATLRSLPVRARAAGLAEVVKAAAIRDAGFFCRSRARRRAPARARRGGAAAGHRARLRDQGRGGEPGRARAGPADPAEFRAHPRRTPSRR